MSARSHKSDVYIGIGSNLGNREVNLSRAISMLQAAGFQLLGESSIFETEPVDYREQPWFLNQVARFAPREHTTGAYGDAEELLDCLLEIEKMMGRERLLRAGPRIIDLDLLLYGDLVIVNQKSHRGPETPATLERAVMTRDSEVNLVVPHPRLHLRRFVLVPLSELAGDMVHPVLGKTIAELLVMVTDKSTVKLYSG